MSDTIGGKPPIPKAYLEAMADQRAGVVQRGPENRYRFVAERRDGIKAIFWVMAHDTKSAATKVTQFCESMGWVNAARVVGARSAYDRASAERNAGLGKAP